MKILITGANGLLGQYLIKRLLQNNWEVTATGKGPDRTPDSMQAGYRYYDMDITDGTAVYDVMHRVQPEVVIHAAAMTQVDECEQHPARCERVNVVGTANVLTEAESLGSHFIYVSTDFVFDGERGDYDEEDDLNPVNYYGFTKMQAEAMVQTATLPWSIVRTCLVYGHVLQGTRQNIITWVRQSLEQGKPIRVVADQWRTPTYVEDLANGIALIVEKKAQGIYHISGRDLLTPYAMAIQTANGLQRDTQPIAMADASNFTQPGRRPLKTGLRIDKAMRDLGYQPLSFEEGLRRTLSGSDGQGVISR